MAGQGRAAQNHSGHRGRVVVAAVVVGVVVAVVVAVAVAVAVAVVVVVVTLVVAAAVVVTLVVAAAVVVALVVAAALVAIVAIWATEALLKLLLGCCYRGWPTVFPLTRWRYLQLLFCCHIFLFTHFSLHAAGHKTAKQLLLLLSLSLSLLSCCYKSQS